MSVLDSDAFEGGSMVIIAVYTLFIMFWLISPEFIPDAELVEFERTMENIDRYFLIVFTVEIIMSMFGTNLMYITDYFNMFDTVIVIISLVMNLLSISVKFLGVLRLIRVVVLILRQITGNTVKLKYQNKMADPYGSTITILQELAELPEASNKVRKDAKWALDLIESNKLYDMNFDMSNEQKNMDLDAKAWLNMTTEIANDTTKWFERDLDDFLKEIHREEEDDP